MDSIETIKLTKVIRDDAGNEMITCVNYGTEQCPYIRDSSVHCGACPVFALMLEKLHTFEEIVDECEENAQ